MSALFPNIQKPSITKGMKEGAEDVMCNSCWYPGSDAVLAPPTPHKKKKTDLTY